MYCDPVAIFGFPILDYSIVSAFGLNTCIGLREYKCVYFWKLLIIALKCSITVYSLLMYCDPVAIFGFPLLDYSNVSAFGLNTCIGLREYKCVYFWKLLIIALKCSITVYSLLMYCDPMAIFGFPLLEYSIISAFEINTCIGLPEYKCVYF